MNSHPHYTIITDPASMRWEHYQRDLLGFWNERGVVPGIQVVHWRDVITADGDLRGFVNGDNSLLRIESPARDFNLVRLFLQAGERSLGSKQPSPWKAPHEGWLASPKMFYAGFCSVLNGIEQSIACLPHLTRLACLQDIQKMFDKNLTTEILVDAGLPCPPTFRPPAKTRDLLEELHHRDWDENFIKLAYGSCASGIAVHCKQGPRDEAITSIVEIDQQFYNSMRLRKVSDNELDRVFQFLLQEEATVQKSIRKAKVNGQNFDVRVVVLRGKVAGAIFRVSPNPMTNLHLGGYRGNDEQCRRLIPDRKWAEGMSMCIEAAGLFNVPAIGVDLMFEEQTFSPSIIELNAFGDFFPNWKNHLGQTIHRQEIASTARVLGWI